MAEGDIRVMVVDDREQDAALLGRTIEALTDDVKVVGTATDGPSALELAAGLEYDVAVVDYRMPGMDGLQLAGQLKQRHPERAVVILTAYDDERETILGSPVVDEYLEKMAVDQIGEVLHAVTGRSPKPEAKGRFRRR